MQVQSALLKLSMTFDFHKVLRFLLYLPMRLYKASVIFILEMATVWYPEFKKKIIVIISCMHMLKGMHIVHAQLLWFPPLQFKYEAF